MRYTIFSVCAIILFFSYVPDVIAQAYTEINISPNPCISGSQSTCKSDVTWTTPSDVGVTQVWVSINGGPENIFSCTNQPTKTTSAPWIQKGKIYEFKVYKSTSCTAAREYPYLAAASVTGISNKPSVPDASVGLSKFDAALSYMGLSMGGNGSNAYKEVGRAMTEKAVIDARRTGAKFIRHFAPGWAPAQYGSNGDLAVWIDNPDAYWKDMDDFMDMLDVHDMKIVPMLIAHIAQFPAIERETIGDLIVNRESSSYATAKKYIKEYIQRYKDRDTIYFYEIGGEFNSRADIDLLRTCEIQRGKGSALCDTQRKNFTTGELIGFTTHVASYIRSLDSTRMISSGFTIPRKSAEHLRTNPAWVATSDSWTNDSREEFAKNLLDIHQGTDLLSVHFYNALLGNSTSRENERFGHSGSNNASLLKDIKNISDGAGKLLYVGESGDVSPHISDDASSPFLDNVLTKVSSLNIPYTSPFVWQAYSTNPYTTYDRESTFFNIEPGYTDQIISKILKTNISLDSAPPTIKSTDNKQYPQVVITWPLTDSKLSLSQKIYAVASDNQEVVKLDFLIDDSIVATLKSPPYSATINTISLQSGDHTITARAYDIDGHITSVSISISNGRVTSKGKAQYSDIEKGHIILKNNDVPSKLDGPISTKPKESSAAETPKTINGITLFSTNISYNNLSGNAKGEVQKLKKFLNTYEKMNLSDDDIYDAKTLEAVKSFQNKYRREILEVWNLTEATGYVGITTRLKINSLLNGSQAVCPVFVEYNGGLQGIMASLEIGETQKILQELDMYKGQINNIWDTSTNNALILFQETFREVMLDPWNITKGTGYKYKTTNKFLNYFAGCKSEAVYLEGIGLYEGI